MAATPEEKKRASEFMEDLQRQAKAAGYESVTISICLNGSNVLALPGAPYGENKKRFVEALKALKLSSLA